MFLTHRKFVLAILFLFFAIGLAQSEPFSEYISPDGKILKNFSKARPNISPIVDGINEKKIFYKNGLFKIILKTISIHDKRFGSQECADAVDDLKELLNIYDDPTGPSIEMKKFNERFFLLFIETNYYLVDKDTDTAYLLRESGGGGFNSEIVFLEKITKNYGYSTSLKDAWRIFFRCHGLNGRFAGEPCMTVFDIDCINNKFLGTFDGSLCEDLEHNNHFELIVRDEVYWNLNWYWIYRWENGSWVDSSEKFPDYYKTTVVSYLKNYSIHTAVVKMQ